MVGSIGEWFITRSLLQYSNEMDNQIMVFCRCLNMWDDNIYLKKWAIIFITCINNTKDQNIYFINNHKDASNLKNTFVILTFIVLQDTVRWFTKFLNFVFTVHII